MANGHNTCEVTERLFAAGGHHSSLCQKATTIERSQCLEFQAAARGHLGILTLIYELLFPNFQGLQFEILSFTGPTQNFPQIYSKVTFMPVSAWVAKAQC